MMMTKKTFFLNMLLFFFLSTSVVEGSLYSLSLDGVTEEKESEHQPTLTLKKVEDDNGVRYLISDISLHIGSKAFAEIEKNSTDEEREGEQDWKHRQFIANFIKGRFLKTSCTLSPIPSPDLEQSELHPSMLHYVALLEAGAKSCTGVDKVKLRLTISDTEYGTKLFVEYPYPHNRGTSYKLPESSTGGHSQGFVLVEKP